MENTFIYNRRIELGLSQSEVAEAVGVSKAAVSRWESGDIANMKRNRIAKLAEVLQVSPLQILGMEPVPKKVIPSEEELSIVLAYRKQPEAVQDAIKKMLDIESGEKGSAISVS